LISCSDLNIPFQKEENVSGMGKINITITGISERTILPGTPIFSKYIFIFEAKNGQEDHDDVIINADEIVNLTVELAEGNWTITAKGYVAINGFEGIIDGDYQAAEGKKENIIVSAGQIQTISIDMNSGVKPGEVGIFSWEIKFPDDTQNAALVLQTIEGVDVEIIDLVTKSQGEMILESGYYLVTFRLNNEMIKTEVLHIYGGLTSCVFRYLHKNAFNNLNDLADWLNYAPVNSINNPYDIVLYDLNIETDFYVGIDPIRQLYNVLNGKYINLDMSACKGFTIPNISSAQNTRQNLDRIVSITLPKTLNSIGNHVFNGTRIKNIIMYDNVISIGNYAFANNSFTSIKIPDSVTSIGNYAFANNSELTIIKIPDSVTSIGSYAFSGCRWLADLTIGNSVTSIGEYAFLFCSALTSVTIPDSLTSIGRNAFEASGLTSINIGNSTASFVDRIFFRSELTEINVNLENKAYQSIDGILYSKDLTILVLHPVGKLGAVVIPDGVISIGYRAFEYCYGLTSVLIPDSVINIGDSAFNTDNFYNSLTSVRIGNSVENIGHNAFRRTALTSVTIPNNVIYIGNFAFEGCFELRDVIIGNNVYSIGEYAFSSCPITSIVIPDSVTSISADAFSLCTELTSIFMGKNISNINANAFARSGIIEIHIDPNNETYCSLDGVLYNKNMTILVMYPAARIGEVIIPDTVIVIGEEAFAWCLGITNINIPDNVTHIEPYAFRSSALTSISIGSGVKSIGNHAFWFCTGLTSVIIPDNVINLDGFIFENCTSLASVTFEGNISPENFWIYGNFPGDLRDKYFASNGGPGTYTTENPGDYPIWTKQE